MTFMERKIKLGTFDTVEVSFARYKAYKEDFIKDMEEQYREKIHDKMYQAMVNWEVEMRCGNISGPMYSSWMRMTRKITTRKKRGN